MTLIPQFEPTALRHASPIVAGGPLVVATDGSPRADGALSTAVRLGARHGCTTSVVSVVEPLPIVAPEVQVPVTPELVAERRADLLRAVREQLARVTGSDRTWPVELRQGSPPSEIIEKATASAAKLIVVGLGRHGVVDRFFGDETALQLLRMARIPVLAVPAGADRKCARAIVAMDFSLTAIRAAQISLELLEDGGTLHLVHVVPRDLETAVWESMQDEYGKTVESAFEQVTRQLAVPPSTTVETITLHGEPAHEILQFASRVDADLIAAGSHGYGFFSRLLLGSVATRLLRGATCAVVGVPLASIVLTETEAVSLGREGFADSPFRTPTR